MSVPFIDLKRFEDGFLDQWNKKVQELSANCQFIGGAEVAGLEDTLQKENQVDYAISCANGTDALQLALRAAGLGPGDKVLVPDSTFWATFEAVVNVGASPVTVDISLDDFQMDFELFQKAVAEHKPKGAVLVHLYGWGSTRLADFRQFCRDHKIALIEDGAQAYGVEYKGEPIYKDAQLSTISFYPAKVYGGAGDGGAVLTNDETLAKRVRSLGNHGREEHYAHGLCGWNSRMDTFQGAYLNLVHPHLSARLDSRRDMAEKYRAKLAPLGVKVISPPADYKENGYLNVTLHEPEKRTELQAVLKDKGIGAGVVYPGAVSDQKAAGDWIAAQVGGDAARQLAKTVLNLPLFPYMKEAELDEVVQAVAGVYK